MADCIRALGYESQLINNSGTMPKQFLALAAVFALLVSGATAVALLAQDTAAKPVVEVYKSPT